jgi:uncharacterized protein involved in outer membrane biogenesis
MKKLLIRILIGLVVLVIVVVVAIGLFLDSAIKKGVETVGPQITKVDIKLDGVNLSLRAGSATIKGLVVGNPEGYKTPHAISVGSASVVVRARSVLSDKIIIKSIRVEAPEITYEGNLLGADNLHKILGNVSSAAGTGSGADSASSSGGKPAKKLQVDDFLITGAKVIVSIKGTGGLAAPVTIPDIHLSNLGQGPEGITAAELTKQVLEIVTADVVKYAVSQATDIGKGVLDTATGAGKGTTESVEKATKGVTDLFKKKK